MIVRVARLTFLTWRGLVVVASLFGALLAPNVAFAAPPTIVTLTFDDEFDNQYQVGSMLAQHSMHGTFYVNSGYIGTAGSLTWDQLVALQAGGNEIAGHTIDHVNLTTVSTAEATRQVCDDRQALISHGLNATDFAYPNGAYNATVKSIVQSCGYNSGRRSWGLCEIAQSPPGCTLAETIPPLDRYEIRTVESIRSWHTLANIEGAVTRAESNGGGWVILVFHNVCDDCDSSGYSISPSTLSAFMDWLQPRSTTGTYTRMMQNVIGDQTPPVSSIACNGSSCSSGWYGPPVSISLSAIDAGTAVSAIRYTTDGSDPTASSPLYSGPFTVSGTTTVKYRAWDMRGNVEATKSQVIQVDATPPTSSITCNGTSCSSDPYTSGVSISLSAIDTQSGAAAIRYTLDGSTPTTASPLYVAPFTVASTTTVKYRAWDNAGNVEPTNSQLIQIQTPPADTTPPSSSIACNSSACSSGWYGAAVSVSLSASDSGSGVAAIRYTTDGSDPSASSPLYTAPFSVSSTTTVKYRAWDNAGNVEPTDSQLIQIDTTAPSSSIACNGSACSSTPYSSAVTVSLSASDGGSGVAEVHYTIDGSDPTLFSPVYTGTFSLSATATVKYRAWDNAANVEPTKSQLIQIDATPGDTTPPSSSIGCNGATCSSGWYTSSVSVSLSASDTGSGVAAIRYTTDGSDPNSSSPLYSGPFSVASTTTVKYRAWDNAGNLEATKTQLIQVDTTVPVSAIACNGSSCGNTWFAPPVNVSLSATDAGSGVAAIRYTTDGTTPTNSSPLYTAPFSLTSTSTVKYRAWDVAGNTEATKTQVVQVDISGPTVSITSPTNSAIVSGNIRITASASDAQSGVASVAFYVDNTLIGTSNKSPWQVQWNTKKVSVGQHVLTAVATDRTGKATTSAAITVTVR